MGSDYWYLHWFIGAAGFAGDAGSAFGVSCQFSNEREYTLDNRDEMRCGGWRADRVTARERSEEVDSEKKAKERERRRWVSHDSNKIIIN